MISSLSLQRERRNLYWREKSQVLFLISLSISTDHLVPNRDERVDKIQETGRQRFDIAAWIWLRTPTISILIDDINHSISLSFQHCEAPVVVHHCQPPNENILACRAWKKKTKLHPGPVSLCWNQSETTRSFSPNNTISPLCEWLVFTLAGQRNRPEKVWLCAPFLSSHHYCWLQSNRAGEIDLIMQTAAGVVIRPQRRDKWILFIKNYSDQLISPQKPRPDVTESNLEIGCNQGDLSSFSPWCCLLF